MSISIQESDPRQIKVTRIRGTGNELWFLPLKRERDPRGGKVTYGAQWDDLIDSLERLDAENDGALYALASQETEPWSQCRVSIDGGASLPLRYRPGRAKDTVRDIPMYGIWFDLDTGFEMLERCVPASRQLGCPVVSLITDSDILRTVFFTYRCTPSFDSEDPQPTIAVNVIAPDATRRCYFDLVVDLGNTRTTCLALIDPGRYEVANDIRSLIVPVGFAASDELRGLTTQGSREEIVDSEFVLRDPITADWVQLTAESHGRLTGRGYQPPGAMLGPDVRAARQVYAESRVFMSSPKRYIWDEGEDNTWQIGRRPWANALPTVGGESTERLSAHESPGCPHLHDPALVPRKYAVVWLAMCILDAAVDSVAEHFLSSPDFERCLPTLRGIRVTFPTGWGEKECKTYQRLWDHAYREWMKRRGMEEDLSSQSVAKNVPGRLEASIEADKDNRQEAHLHDSPDSGTKTNPWAPGTNGFVKVDLDEATASQLPILHDLIASLGGNAAGLLSLLGSQDSSVCRIMSVDVGGGSTDVAIVSYLLANPDTNRLKSERGVRFSSATAGDSMLRETLTKIMLPALWKGDADIERALRQLFSENREVNSVFRAGLLTELFVPLLTHWFTNRKNPGTFMQVARRLGRGYMVNFLVTTLCRLGMDAGKQNKIENFNLAEMSGDMFREVVRGEFENIVKSVSDLSYCENVDLMIVTGKTSELPEVQDYLREFSSLPLSRVVFVHDLSVGSWYPYRSHNGGGHANVIRDAKEMTVVGAALYTLIERSALAAWQKLDLQDNVGDCVWMAIDRLMRIPEVRHGVISSREGTLSNLMPGQMIGRRWKEYDVPALPLYRVHVPDPTTAACGLDVSVIRKEQELVAVNWYDHETRKRRTDEIELVFQTSFEDTCWRDSGLLF